MAYIINYIIIIVYFLSGNYFTMSQLSDNRLPLVEALMLFFASYRISTVSF